MAQPRLVRFDPIDAIQRSGRVALAAAVFAFCYARVMGSVLRIWSSSSVYSYGFVVLLVSAYVAWSRLDELRTLPRRADYLLGVPITLAGLAALLAGRLALMTSLQQASMVVTLGGLVLLLFGRRLFARAWFPIAYLLLAMPIWDVVISRLQPPSQILSARLATAMLHLIGIPVLQEGTRIILPNVTMEVLRECSGVNQLFAIVAMGLAAAYLMLNRNLLRSVVVGIAVLVAYVSNSARITLVGWLAYNGLGNGDLRSVHILEGLAVSTVGYLLLFACIGLLARIERKTRLRTAASSPAISAPDSGRRAWLELGICVVTIAIGAFVILFRPIDVRLRNDLRAFPNRIAEWTADARPDPMSLPFPTIDDDLVQAYPSPSGWRRFDAPDDDLVRTYRNIAGEPVKLYVGYHRSQRQGKELGGEAGRALSKVSAPVTLELDAGTVEVGHVVQTTRGRHRGVLYWYDLNGRIVDNPYSAKGYMAWDALTRWRTNGAVVLVSWEAQTGANADAARDHAISFAQAVLTLLPRYIPS